MNRKEAFKRIRHAEHECKRLEQLFGTYDLGGGRNCGSKPCDFKNGLYQGKYVGDCSWLQCYICDILGIKLKSPIGWTGTLVNEGLPGHGKLYTIHIKDPFDTEGHTIGQFHHPIRDRWVECGGSDNPHPGDGVTFWHPTAERIAEFPYKRHFHGF